MEDRHFPTIIGVSQPAYHDLKCQPVLSTFPDISLPSWTPQLSLLQVCRPLPRPPQVFPLPPPPAAPPLPYPQRQCHPDKRQKSIQAGEEGRATTATGPPRGSKWQQASPPRGLAVWQGPGKGRHRGKKGGNEKGKGIKDSHGCTERASYRGFTRLLLPPLPSPPPHPLRKQPAYPRPLPASPTPAVLPLPPRPSASERENPGRRRKAGCPCRCRSSGGKGESGRGRGGRGG